MSKVPYNTLNTSFATGDRPDFVRQNLNTINDAIGADNLIFTNQIHGKGILVLRRETFSNYPKPVDADAIITDIPRLGLMVKQADCQAVIIFDSQKKVISNVHCGWRGNTLDILGSTVTRMTEEFGCKSSDLTAAIGPSLGPCCAEFVTYDRIFPGEFKRFMVRKNYFDLWETSLRQLLHAGLKDENIEIAGICTRCRTNLFYSYRAEKITGRFATVVMLK